ncbi:MAG: hypothetical protein ACE5FD_11405 [Anaerolineae bacterium]
MTAVRAPTFFPDDFLTVCQYAGSMVQKPRIYHSFLLRMWQADGNGKPIWRFSLEDSRTGVCHNFPDMEAMLSFLKDKKAQSDATCHRDSSA